MFKFHTKTQAKQTTRECQFFFLTQRWIVFVLFVISLAFVFGCGGAPEELVDELCLGIDCSFRGECRVREGKATCICDFGFVAQGIKCRVDYCSFLWCGWGECVVEDDIAYCICPLGIAGEACDQCEDGFVMTVDGCVPAITCEEGFMREGSECVPMTPCALSPCIHGTCRMRGNEQVCDCHVGYDGDRCDRCAPGFAPDGLYCVEEKRK